MAESMSLEPISQLGFMGGFDSKENVRRFEAEPLLLSLLTVETRVGGLEPLK